MCVSWPVSGAIRYRLVPESVLTDECPICARLDPVYPLRGELDVLGGGSPLGTYYYFTNINFRTDGGGPRNYRITGSGSWSFNSAWSPPAARTELTLQIDDGTTNLFCTFTGSGGVPPGPNEPFFNLSARQSNGTDLRTFSISFRCAPVQEIWFSTANGLTASVPGIEPPRVENGDVLSDSGRVVKRSADLLRAFGIEPRPDGSCDLDALTVAPGGEIFFSLRQDVLSPTAGLLRHGDLLSDRGRVVKTSQELMRGFGLMPPVPEIGLDGIQLAGHLPDGGYLTLFSTTTDVFSEKLGVMVTSGDLLREDGVVSWRNQDLLAAFRPYPADENYGLTAFYAWGSGEVWFATEKGFESALGPILAGDLISNRGYVVVRNLDLVSKFQPLEDVANFGLDALFIIGSPWESPSPATLGMPMPSLSPPGVLLRWEMPGRVSQVESAATVGGPYQPLSTIIPDTQWLDRDASPTGGNRFYRVRSW